VFIELSGIDGSGKTSFADRIMRLFNTSQVPCYHRSFRSTFKRIAADLAARQGSRHWRGLFEPNEIEVAQAFEMVQLVYQQLLPLDLGAQVIVTDTYLSGWLATAKLWGCSAMDRVAGIYSLLPPPDLSILLDVPVAEARRRLGERPKGDHIMKIGADSVLDSYAEAFVATRPLMPYPQVIVNGDQPLEATWLAVRKAVLGRSPHDLDAPR
jgi:thymidylate kinase